MKYIIKTNLKKFIKVRTLALILLIIMAFFRGNTSQVLMIISTTAWIIAVIISKYFYKN